VAQDVAVPLELEEAAFERPHPALRALHLARRHPLGVFGLLMVGLLFFCGIFADLVAPYGPTDINRAVETRGQLAEAIDAEQKQFMVVDGSDLNVGQTLTLGEEQITIFAVIDNQVADSQRGARQSEAAPHDAGAPLQIIAVNKLANPSTDHPFGTDGLGRDVLSRTIYGARISLMIGLVSIFFGVTIGALFGVMSGYLGGFTDSVIQRSVDVLLAFPAVVLLLAIITVIGDDDSAVRQFLADNTPVPQGTFLGVPNFLDLFVISLGIGIVVIGTVARIVRGAVLSIKENVYVEAARALGASDARVMWRHIFPNVAALVVILASLTLPLAILAEAAISFLGVGVPQPTPSWGADLTGDNRLDAQSGNWWVVLFPGLALSLVVLGFNMLGDAFRDISDPRLRGAGGSGQTTSGTGL
jgi:peptide/nickel transport system permease protein